MSWVLPKSLKNIALVSVYENKKGIFKFLFSTKSENTRTSKPFTSASPALNGSSSPVPPDAARSFPNKLL